MKRTRTCSSKTSVILQVQSFTWLLSLSIVLLAAATDMAHGQTEMAQSPTYTVLHTFTGGSDGASPTAGLVRDAAGNLYGTTVWGGTNLCIGYGCGVVFKMDPQNQVTILHVFAGETDGLEPQARLLPDAEGNLYGTTCCGGYYGAGTVFKIDRKGHESVLYSFTGGEDGGSPQAALTWDSAENLVGTTLYGGSISSCNSPNGCGVVFRIDRHLHETVLHAFTSTDGAYPYDGLTGDALGNLYGTTYNGGDHSCGVVFKLDRSGNETVLHSFGNQTGDGCSPYSGVTLDAQGNLYGTTLLGGQANHGVVFKIDRFGNASGMHTFTGRDGSNPSSDLVQDTAGNLYGTTVSGGEFGYGVVFKLEPSGKQTILHNFDYSNGAFPWGRLLPFAGALYGATNAGGDPSCGPSGQGCGVLFRIQMQ